MDLLYSTAEPNSLAQWTSKKEKSTIREGKESLKFTKLVTVSAIMVATLASSNGVYAASVEFTNSNASINSSYDRAGAVAFIKSYAAKPGYTVSPYTTYGDPNLYGGGGDCTNFASQILHLGGGLPFHGQKGYNRNTVDWYYYGPNVPPATNPRTSSWTGAHEFRQHWGVVNGVGGKYAYQMRKYTNAEAAGAYYTEIYQQLWKGDIIQYVDSTGMTQHTQIVWNYADGVMNVSEHSVDGNYWGLEIGLKTELEERQYDGGYVILLKIKQSGN